MTLLSSLQYKNLVFESPGGSGLFNKSCSTLMTLWIVACLAPLSMGFPGKNTGVGCHFPLQGSHQGKLWVPWAWVQIPLLLLISHVINVCAFVRRTNTEHCTFFQRCWHIALKYMNLPSWGTLTHFTGTTSSHANVWAEAHDLSVEKQSIAMWFSSSKC